jgi:tetratricopeptide (TPR) repeat protein
VIIRDPMISPASSATGASLNDTGYRLMQEQRYIEALPLLQQAVAKLHGTYSSGYRYEAWANYNLGYTLLQLGRCREALPRLVRSQQLQGPRIEILRARREARKCAT